MRASRSNRRTDRVRVDEGETRYEGGRQYDFESLVSFKEGNRERRARLFVTDDCRGPDHRPGHRAAGARAERRSRDLRYRTPPSARKGLLRRGPAQSASTRIATPARWGGPEWPPFNPPEQQWLFNDDLVGGWGQTRLQVEPTSPRQADRFLTVLVPTDEGANAPTVLPARAAVGDVAGAVIRQGSRNDVVIFSADANGGELTRAAVDVNLEGRTGDVTIATLTPGARYSVRMGGGAGRVQRIVITPTLKVGVAADAAGIDPHAPRLRASGPEASAQAPVMPVASRYSGQAPHAGDASGLLEADGRHRRSGRA